MAEADTFHVTKTQWLEIAALAFFLALLAWLVNNARKAMTPQQSVGDSVELPSPYSNPAPSIPSLGIPPLTLPGTPNEDDCGCMGCAASGTAGIQQIVALTNQALQAQYAAGDATIQALANIGTDESGGVDTFVAAGTASGVIIPDDYHVVS